MKLYTFFFIIVTCCCELNASSTMEYKNHYNFSVAKIEATQIVYAYDFPWKAASQMSSIGTGFVVDQNHIITAAHVVGFPAFLKIQLMGEKQYYEAKIEVIDQDCDLAYLRVDDPEFMKKAVPLELASECFAGLDIFTLGFPEGGGELSVTRGNVSRQEVQKALESHRKFLLAQMDILINPGSSGGPVLDEQGGVVGVVISYNKHTRTSRMVPLSLLQHFIKETKNEKYLGFPFANLQVALTINPDLKNFYQCDRKGVVVTSVPPKSFLDGYLMVGDVLLEIDGHSIENDAKYSCTSSEQIMCNHLFAMHFYNDTMQLKIKRKGHIQLLEVPVKKKLENDELLVPYDPYGSPPSYLIVGGLVFQPLTMDYIHIWEDPNVVPTELLYYTEHATRRNQNGKDEIVLLSKVLPSSLTLGYEYTRNFKIEFFNGVQVNSLKHLAELVDTCQDEYFCFENEVGLKMILKRQKVLEEQKKILEIYQIPFDRSKDLRKS